MSAIRNLLRPFFPILPKLEADLLDYVCQHSPDASIAAALTQTARTINQVLHYPGWKTTELSRVFFGKVVEAKGTEILTPLPTWLICTLSFKVEGLDKPIRAKYWLGNNHLFSVEYSTSIKGIKNSIPQIVKIEYNLPKTLDTSASTSRLSKAELIELLGGWATKLEVQEIKPAEAPGIRAEIFKQIKMKLPRDYLTFSEKCGGFTTKLGHVFGATELQLVTGKDRDYLVLAELAEAYYIVATEQEELLLIDHEEVQTRSLQNGFLDALRETLTSDSWIQ